MASGERRIPAGTPATATLLAKVCAGRGARAVHVPR